jgi:hypothetical protein
MMALTVCTPFDEQEIPVKNTFVQMTSTSPCRPILRRSMTDSALCCAPASEKLWIDSDGVDSEASTATVAQVDDFTTDTESDDDGQHSSEAWTTSATNDMEGFTTDTEEDADDEYSNTQWNNKSMMVHAGVVFPVPCLQHALVAPQCASFEGEVDDDRTTVMLCNVPIEFTPAMLLELFDSMCLRGMYDFVYMPIDFKTHWWRGFAFVNCVSHRAALHFMNCLQGFCNWPFPCKKVCECKWGEPKQQGREANVEHFRNNSIMHDSIPLHWKPLLFENGMPVEFPLPTKSIKAPRVWWW